ncbi:EML2 [Branchiostoma lanceolatum]|uniref:EML2 protein n=1 Tax=Branchiostoma lanceolatum TaxID=7740 RepID=A0A8J9ZBP0_BRALA|nr:EML2 [Branchiostoma lanceolatum]
MVDAPLQHGFSPSFGRRSSRQSSSSIQRLSFSLSSHRRISGMSSGDGEGFSRQGSTMSRGGSMTMRGFGGRTSITSDLGALMELDGNQGQSEIEHEIREQLRGPLEDISRQRLRAMRMALRRYGNVDSRISQKDFLAVFQEYNLKISSRLLSLMLHRFENQFGVDYENMWKLMYDTQHTTGRDSVMAKNASNENSNADQLNQSFHNSADLKLVERIKTQFAKSGDEFDLEEFRDELKVRDRGHTTTLSKKEMKKAVAEMQVPIYGNVMNALMKRCDDECNGQISWPEFLRFLTAAKDSLARGEDGIDLNASGSKLWNTGTTSTRTSTGEDPRKMSTVSSGPRLIEGTPYGESPRPTTPLSLGLKRNSMPTPKASSVSPRKSRSMASDTLRGYDGSSSGTEDSRKRRGSPIAEETHRTKSTDSLSALTEPKPPPAQQATTPAPAPEQSPKTSPPPDQSTAQRKDEKATMKKVPSKEKIQPAQPSTAPPPPLKEEPPTPPVNAPTPSPAPIPPQDPPTPTTAPSFPDKPPSEPNGIVNGKPPLPENSTETKSSKESLLKSSKESLQKSSQRKTSPPSRENTIDKDPPQRRPTKSAISRKSVHIVEKRESSASVVKKLPPKSAPPKRSATDANLRRVSSQSTKTQPSKSTVDLRKNSPPPKESPPLPGEAQSVPTPTPSQTPIPHIPSANSLTSESILSQSQSGSELEASMQTSASNNSLASLASKKVTTAENSNQSDSSEVKQEEEAKNLARRESTITITSVNMSNKDEEAPKKKGMFGSMKKFFGSKSKPKKEEIPIETIKEPEKPKEPEVPPPDGKPLTVNIRGTDLDVYIPDRYWWKPVNHKYPEHKLSLDWVYGYRGNDCRNNLFPLASGEVVYFTGTVAVIYDHSQCRQRHYMEHTGEIRSIAVHPDKVTVATGQNEVQYDSYSQAHIRIWDSRTLQTQKVLGTGTMEKAVIALTFSGTLDRLAAIDSSEGHMMSVWDIKSGKKLTEAKVDTEVVCQVGFSPRSPDTIVTAGKEHLVWWELGVETGTLQEVARANYDQRYNKAKYIICFLHNERGDLITGDSNGTVFVWGEGGNNITQALKHIHEGPVFSLLMMKNFLLTAGRDGMVYAFPWGKNMEHAGFSASLQVPRIEGGIRMQCTTADGAVLLLGTTVNSILSVALTSAGCPLQGASLDKDVVTQGHFDDVKAICPQPSHAAPGQFVTAGNDGTVCMHDSESHSLQWKYVIKGATIQCADYYHPGSLPRVALGTKDGSVIVLEVNDLDEVAEMCRASKIARGRITVIKICPDGDRIAIGCQDGSVQILQLTDYCSKLELLGKCKGHKGAITGLDWSADLPTGGYIIQTSSSTYQHFLWDVDQCVQLTDMAGLRNTEWLTYNCMLGYVVKDVWNAGLDGRDVRTLDRAPNWRHVGTADERGEIHMFTYPCAHKDAQADTYKCHSSQVSCLRFLHDNVHLVTAGGKDTSILLWKIISQ